MNSCQILNRVIETDKIHATKLWYTENFSKFQSNNWLSCQSLWICYTQSCKFCVVFGEHLYHCQFSAVFFLKVSFLKGNTACAVIMELIFSWIKYPIPSPYQIFLSRKQLKTSQNHLLLIKSNPQDKGTTQTKRSKHQLWK